MKIEIIKIYQCCAFQAIILLREEKIYILKSKLREGCIYVIKIPDEEPTV